MAKKERAGKRLTPDEEAEADRVIAELFEEILRDDEPASPAKRASPRVALPELPSTAGQKFSGARKKSGGRQSPAENSDPLHLNLRRSASDKSRDPKR
ncbi:MAG: hypothetical protein HY903_12190 [Deltaproteobacteria bacterium]|nr:hypothetical protein [Deltaproteobacteria bacterium]